jgi:hypothetical protein
MQFQSFILMIIVANIISFKYCLIFLRLKEFINKNQLNSILAIYDITGSKYIDFL